MAYGIEVENSSGKLQFGTGVRESLTMVASGTANPGDTVTGIDPTKEFLAFNRTTAGFIRGNHNISGTPGTSWSPENNSSSNYGAINWIKVRIASLAGAQNTGYGINVFTAAGAVSFSSNFTYGLDVKQVLNPGDFGSQQGQNNVSPFTNTSAAMPADIGYTITNNTFANYYVAPGLMQFDVTVQNGVTRGGIRRETFKFNSNYTIGVEGLVSYSFISGLGGSMQRARVRQTNSSAILVILRRG